jgi:hypothetical protein
MLDSLLERQGQLPQEGRVSNHATRFHQPSLQEILDRHAHRMCT